MKFDPVMYLIESRILRIFFIICLPVIAFSQPYKSTYKISGSVNVDSGRAIFLPLGNSSNYHYQSSVSSKIVAGHFEISDSIEYPTSYALRIDIHDTPVYISEFFMVDSGMQAMNFDVNKGRVEPEIVNRSMNELNNDYYNYLKETNEKRNNYYTYSDSLTSLYPSNLPNDLSVELSKRWKNINLLEFSSKYRARRIKKIPGEKYWFRLNEG
ncbi:MAG TPA: hypothetical protein VGM63_12820 [Mucilaginibacter sp.]